MRTFIALDLNEEIKDYLFELENELKKIFKAKIRWMNKNQIHITLKFIGEIKEEKLNEVKEILKKINFKKFSLELNEIGFFPSKEKPAIIWVGLKNESEIINLQRKIDEELLKLFSSEQKFSSHITLGRIKLIKDKKNFLQVEKKHIMSKTFEVKSFSLIESILSKDGSKYKKIAGAWLKKIPAEFKAHYYEQVANK